MNTRANDIKYKKSCGCIVIQDGKVLMIGAKDNNQEIFWSFPKGHQEKGETDSLTALRETKEEVGLDVEIIDSNPARTGHFEKGGTQYKEILLFLAKPIGGGLIRQEEEVEYIEWVPIASVNDKLGDKLSYYNEVWAEIKSRLPE